MIVNARKNVGVDREWMRISITEVMMHGIHFEISVTKKYNNGYTDRKYL